MADRSDPAPNPATPKVRGGRRRLGFPIVGIGASAGGLEAFTALLRKLPVDTGFGFVLVQHLDPQHESALTQLLARATAMPVSEAAHNQRVKANHVYIIPPNTSLGIARGILKLQPRARSRLAPRAIDVFLEALAKDQEERAIGIILSGTATDGTLGLEAIKAAGGLTFAQDDSARYDSMPRSAAEAGCVDFVLSPAAIASELTRIARHPLVRGRARVALANGMVRRRGAAGPAGEQESYQEILRQLRAHSGVDFSGYKASTLQRRIQRRTLLNRQKSLGRYVAFLRGNTKELEALYADVLIGVTSFFRNREAFAALEKKLLSRLVREPGEAPVRVWVLGCSTGQEAYSIAIALTEAAEKFPHPRSFQVFATDLSEANLEKARHGLYAATQVQDVSPDRLRRFFVAEEGGYRVIKALREKVVFARHNLIGDPPFSRMDLVSCRNLMIYLEPSLQKKVLPTFHYALNPAGGLFLGTSESIGLHTALFEPLDKRQRIFIKKAAPLSMPHLPIDGPRGARLPGAAATPVRSVLNAEPGRKSAAWRGELDPQREADRVTVAQFAPPGVLINGDGQVLQFRGSTGAYLEPPTGRATFDLLKMARKGLMLPLRSAIEQAKTEGRPVRKADLAVDLAGRAQRITIEVLPLRNLRERCYLVLFAGAVQADAAFPVAPVAPSPAGLSESFRCADLERELAETRDYLRALQEQQEVANAELQAANEEGESANEELQSLNEELETSKEELESTNEELTTVNEEVVNRNAELNRLNSDLINLQASTRLAIVLLDSDQKIRRFSPQAEQQLNLVAADLGRPLRLRGHGLHLPDLNALTTGVMASGRACEREVLGRDGRWQSLRVQPYLNAEAEVDGAVLVLVDIDELKRKERLIRDEQLHAEALIQTVPNPLVLLNAALDVVSANDAFFRAFRLKPAQAKGRSLFRLDRGSWNLPRLRRLLERVLPRQHTFNDFEVAHSFPRIGWRCLLFNARTLHRTGDRPREILLGIQDITAQRRAADTVRKVQAKLAVHARNLEHAVAGRTAQLTAKNTQLQKSSVALIQRKEQYRALLVQAQVMQRKLRQLTHHMITVQEEERKAISRELHDEVVQTLVGINVELAALGRGATKGGTGLQERIARTQRLVEGSVHAVHRFARELRPAVLDDLGLIPALHAYSQSLAARKKIKVHLSAHRGVEVLDIDRRAVLFRVAQEALTNVVRHAQATEVQLHLTLVPGGVRMEIADNGRAFSVEKALHARNQKRLGLIGMRERLEMVGGRLTLHSAPGRGTTVIAELPVPRRKATL